MCRISCTNTLCLDISRHKCNCLNILQIYSACLSTCLPHMRGYLWPPSALIAFHCEFNCARTVSFLSSRFSLEHFMISSFSDIFLCLWDSQDLFDRLSCWFKGSFHAASANKFIFKSALFTATSVHKNVEWEGKGPNFRLPPLNWALPAFGDKILRV